MDMKPIHAIYYFFDKMEDHIRAHLSRHPFVYTFIGGSGVVLFWRGIWHTADAFQSMGGFFGVMFSPVGSIVTGVTVLLSTGLFVSIFIGDSIILSGIRHDKKIIERAIEDVETEKTDIEKMLDIVTDMKNEMEILESKVRAKCEVAE
jgi:hypothetical protein